MDDTKGDNESASGKVTVRDTDEEVDKDKTDNNDDDDDERNKVDDGDDEAHEKTTVEEDIADTDKTNDVADEGNDDGDKHNEEEGRDDNEAAVEGEEAEHDDAGHDNKTEESAANDAEDNKEAEIHESEPSVHEDDDAVEQDKTEEKNEDATTEEEGREGEEEGQKEEAAEEEEEQMVDKTDESLDGDNIEQNGSRDLTEEDTTRCRLMFDKKAINGRLNLQGFKTVFRVLGQIISSEEAGRMFEDGDRDDDDTLDFEEFFRLYAKFRQEEQTRRAAILDSVDKLFLCGSGDTIELKKMLMQLYENQRKLVCFHIACSCVSKAACLIVNRVGNAFDTAPVQQLLLKLQQPDLDIRLVREKSDLGVDEVKQMIKSLDKQGSGFISKEEFVNIMCQHLEI